jgi:hypothetical protein
MEFNEKCLFPLQTIFCFASCYFGYCPTDGMGSDGMCRFPILSSLQLWYSAEILFTVPSYLIFSDNYYKFELISNSIIFVPMIGFANCSISRRVRHLQSEY